MSKMFDTILHSMLVDKFKYYNVSHSSLKFFKLYLLYRHQSVNTNGCFSNNLPVHSGVPKIFILGPTMFIIYVSDFSYSVSNEHVKRFMFANDLVVHNSCKYFSLANHLIF